MRYLSDLAQAWSHVTRLARDQETPFNVTRTQFIEASCNRYSRAFAYSEGKSCFLPVLEFVNHRNPSNVAYELRNGGDGDDYVAFTIRCSLLSSYTLSSMFHRFSPILVTSRRGKSWRSVMGLMEPPSTLSATASMSRASAMSISSPMSMRSPCPFLVLTTIGPLPLIPRSASSR